MIDIKVLEQRYFYVDEPVPYKLQSGDYISINPISVKDSDIFISSLPILTIEKNEMPSVEIIQMSYLQFLCEVVFRKVDDTKQASEKQQELINAFINILLLSLDLHFPDIVMNEKGKYCIYDKEKNIVITPKDFENIKKIILHQNLYKYDDTYINPDAKKAMAEVDALKAQDYEPLTLERKIAIISSHTGINKKEQLEMTYRSHCLLFDEVRGEVEYSTARPAVLIGGGGKDFEDWIYKKKTNKYKKYFVSDKQYNQSMGGDGNIIASQADSTSSYMNQFNNFNQGGN